MLCFVFDKIQKNDKVEWIRNCGKKMVDSFENWKIINGVDRYQIRMQRRNIDVSIFCVNHIGKKTTFHAKHDHIDIFIASFDRKKQSAGSGLKEWNSFADSGKALKKHDLEFRMWTEN